MWNSHCHFPSRPLLVLSCALRLAWLVVTHLVPDPQGQWYPRLELLRAKAPARVRRCVGNFFALQRRVPFFPTWLPSRRVYLLPWLRVHLTEHRRLSMRNSPPPSFFCEAVGGLSRRAWTLVGGDRWLVG